MAAFATLLACGAVLAQVATEPEIVLSGHEGAVLMGAFTPDGERVVTAAGDQTARLWLASSGEQLRRYDGHTGPLYCLAVSGDGRTLVTGAQDNTVRVWDLPLNRPLRTLSGHTHPVRGIALSSDGRSLASVSEDKTLRIAPLDENPAAPGQPLPAVVRPGHVAGLRAVASRNDGALLASADESGRILFWSPDFDVPQGACLGHAGKLTALRFPANNQQLLSAGDDGMVRLWQLPPTLPKLTATGGAAGVDLVLQPGQPIAVWGTADGLCRLIQLTNGEVLREFPKGESALAAIAVAPNSDWIAISGADGQTRIFGFNDATPRGVVAGHSETVTDVAVHPDAQRFATSGKDGTVRVWQQPKPPSEIAGHTAALRGIAGSASGQWFATISDDLTTRIWAANGSLQRQMGNHEQPLRAMALRDDDGLLATGDAQGIVWIWNPANGAVEGYVAAHAGAITALEFSADRGSLLTAGADGKVRSWTLPLPKQKPAEGEESPKPAWEFAVPGNVPGVRIVQLGAEQGLALLPASGQQIVRLKRDGAPLPAINSPGRPLKTLERSSDGAMLLAVDDQGAGHFWSVDGTIARSVPLGAGVTSAQFDRTGKLLAVCDGKNRVRVMSAENGLVHEELLSAQPVTDAIWADGEQRSLAVIGAAEKGIVLPRALLRLWEGISDGATAVAFLADQQHLLCGGADGGIRLWNLNDGSLVRSFEGHIAPVSDLAVTPNGQVLCATGADKTLRTWELGNGNPLQTMAHPQPVRSLTLSPDSLRAATACEDGKVRVWEVATGRLLESFAEHTGPIASVRYLGDGQTLVSTGDDKTLRQVRTSSVRAIPAHTGPVRSFALYNGGAQTVSSGDDGRVVMIDVNGGNEVREFKLGDLKPTAVAARSDNQRVAAGTETGEVFVWQAGNGEEPLLRLKVSAAVASLAFSPDQQKLAVATTEQQLLVFGPTPPGVQPQVELVLHQTIDTSAVAREILFAADNRSLWAGLDSGAVEEWGYAAPSQTRQFNHGGPVYGVAVSRDGRTVVSCSTDQTARVWDVSTGQQRFQLNGHQGAVHAIALSADETFAVSSGADGTLRLWDIVGGRQLKQLIRFEATMYSVAVHPQGNLIAAAGADRKVHLLDMISGTEQRTLEGHSDYVHCITFDPKGERLMSYGYAGHLKVWNVADGRLLQETRVGRVGNHAQFAPADGRCLLSNGDGTARILGKSP